MFLSAPLGQKWLMLFDLGRVSQLYFEQSFPASVDDVWEFISSPKNLKLITPPYMNFEITSKDLPEKMYQGMIIVYRVSPLPFFRVQWVTEITVVKEKEYFVDEQKSGPYSFWHHQHFLLKTKEGVLMKDIVSYKPPFGFLGAVANSLFIKKNILRIFSFRKSALENIFST